MTDRRRARTVPIPEPGGSRPVGTAGGRSRATQRGAATVLVAGVALVTMLVAGMLLVVAGYVAAVHRVRGAADLVALSAAAAFARGRDACAAAEALAVQNGVLLGSCRVRGDVLEFAVSVTVSRPVATPSPLFPGSVTATASAGRTGLEGGSGSAGVRWDRTSR
ncbi:Rv3654c family TadE-like protein [Propionicimonas sp.]|uniref:Rv3654c family TadE-like protein n=1 Tax=Propionicimonas sp. TaxID=1955623 RepID=UPI0039E5A1D9